MAASPRPVRSHGNRTRSTRDGPGVTITSGSGTIYPVPEPATFAALAGGVAAPLRRRRASRRA